MEDLLRNADITSKHVPKADATWDEINIFAHTFDGYTETGSFERCAEVAHERRTNTLSDLRTCLFFEARSWRHSGESPEGEDLAYLKGVVEKIASKVRSGDLR